MGEPRGRFFGLLGIGVLLAAAVLVAAVIAEADFAIPVVILIVIVVAMAVAYRLIAGSNPAAEHDSADAGLPKAPPDDERPLGDTPEAHDEVNVHDLPPDHPGRRETEKLAGGTEGTTPGPLP